MKRALILIIGVLLIFSSCSCSGNLKSVSTGSRDNLIDEGTPVRKAARRRSNHITARTVQVQRDCSAKEGEEYIAVDPDRDFDGRGTGVIVRSKDNFSYVFTAAHVIGRKGYDDRLVCRISVIRDISSEFPSVAREASVVVKSYDRDIAVLSVAINFKVDTELELFPILGEPVWAAGYPVQLLNTRAIKLSITEGVLATLGVVSPQGVFSHGFYHRVTSQIYFGNSGGGIWTSEGKLVGIAALLYRSSYARVPYEGFYYIKPVGEVVRLLSKEEKFEEVFR